MATANMTAMVISPTVEPEQPKASAVPADSPEPAPAGRSLQPVMRHSGKLLSLIGLLLILAVAAGAFGYYRYHHRKTAPSAVKHDIPLLRVGTADGPIDAFYPSGATTNTSGAQNLNNQIFEGLVGWQDGSKIGPLLATSWSNPNDATWDFTLRPNVKFHSGDTLSAADVKYTLDNFSGAYGDVFGLKESIKSVTVLAPDKVEIVTDQPDPLLLNRLTNFYIIDSHNSKPNDPANGTGPYTLKPGTDPTKDGATDLVAFDGYWGGHVYTRELRFSLYTKESDEIAALKAHQLDLFDLFVDNGSLSQLRAGGIKVIKQPSYSVIAIFLNTLRPKSPLANLQFRQALNVAIERSALIKAADVNGTPSGQFTTPELPGYNPELKPVAQDLTKAKALLTQSGTKNPTITLSYGTDDSTKGLVAELTRELAPLGITLKSNPVDDLDTLIADYQAGKIDMFFASNSSNLFDASDVLSIFQIPGVYDNASADQLLTQAGQTLDGAKRIALLQQASKLYSDDVAAISLYTRSAYYAQTGSAISLKLDIPNVDLGVYFWKVYQP